MQTVFVGQAIRLRSLGRQDLLCAKLFALCDRGIDLADCIALRPTDRELAQLLPWLEQQDANPQWPAHVRETGSEFQVERHGEDVRFESTVIRAAANVLRDRRSDVLQPTALALQHRAYRYRIMMGPNYRADMWAALEKDPSLSAAALARITYGSFSTAWRVHRDFALLAGTSSRGSSFTAHRAKPAKPA